MQIKDKFHFIQDPKLLYLFLDLNIPYQQSKTDDIKLKVLKKLYEARESEK